MEPNASTDLELEGDSKERKKIHFAVPSGAPPTNLDPRQVEMIRRRRPTPATLFRVADQGSPDEDQSTHQVKWVVGENGVLKPKRVNPNVYQPPSLRDQQETAEAGQSDKTSAAAGQSENTSKASEPTGGEGGEAKEEEKEKTEKKEKPRRGVCFSD